MTLRGLIKAVVLMLIVMGTIACAVGTAVFRHDTALFWIFPALTILGGLSTMSAVSSWITSVQLDRALRRLEDKDKETIARKLRSGQYDVKKLL